LYDASNSPVQHSNFSPVNLIIEGVTPFVGINPHRKVLCSFIHLSSPTYQENFEKKTFTDVQGHNEQTLSVVVDRATQTYGQPNCFIPGKYTLKITVYSENASPLSTWLQVNWSGKWGVSLSDISRELVIRKIKKI
jgi:uncharacterized membrane protein YvbJ